MEKRNRTSKLIADIIVHNASPYQIYLDLDGVLVDFEKQAVKIDKNALKLLKNKPGLIWDKIKQKGIKFWSTMPWMSDGRKLWKYFKRYNPIILSAHTKDVETSKQGKNVWVLKNLGKIHRIFCWRSDKKMHAGENNILIDDKPQNIKEWEQAGGIGILHKNTDSTIKKFEKLLR